MGTEIQTGPTGVELLPLTVIPSGTGAGTGPGAGNGSAARAGARGGG
jgi:hypothetical protein